MAITTKFAVVLISLAFVIVAEGESSTMSMGNNTASVPTTAITPSNPVPRATTSRIKQMSSTSTIDITVITMQPTAGPSVTSTPLSQTSSTPSMSTTVTMMTSAPLSQGSSTSSMSTTETMMTSTPLSQTSSTPSMSTTETMMTATQPTQSSFTPSMSTKVTMMSSPAGTASASINLRPTSITTGTSTPAIQSTPRRTMFTTVTSGTDSSLVIIVGATAAIIIVIVLVTAICLCCMCSRNAKSPRESETTLTGNGVHKEQKIGDLERGTDEKKVNGNGNKYISNNEADVYEDTDGMDVEWSDEKKPAEPGKPNGTEVYSNQIYTDDEGKSETKRQSLRSDSTNEETGNIFEKVDPTVDSTDEMELTPKITQPNDDVTNEGGGSEKSETREPAPRSGLKRNISNRKENVLHQLKPRPRPRPRSMTPNPDAQNGNDAQPGSPPKSPETADSPSPRSSSGAGHQFRIPAKGKGPDGSDQAALLANVIRKSNTPRQVEEIETPDSTGTTYW